MNAKRLYGTVQDKIHHPAGIRLDLEMGEDFPCFDAYHPEERGLIIRGDDGENYVFEDAAPSTNLLGALATPGKTRVYIEIANSLLEPLRVTHLSFLSPREDPRHQCS